MSKYDVIIIGAGPGGIFAAYELMQKAPQLKVAVFESGNPLEKRKCPIENITLQMISEERFTSISEKTRRSS